MSDKTLRQSVLAGLGILLFGIGMVVAEPYSGSNQTSGRGGGGGQSPPPFGQTYVEGQIQSLQTRRINGEPMLIARVETSGNRRVPVILGRRSRLGDLDLQPGDRVEIIGRRVRLNRQPALKAQRIRTGGQGVSVGQQPSRQPDYRQSRPPRQEYQGPSSDQQASPSQRTEMFGTIEELKQVKIFGQDEHHLVAVLSSPQGQRRVVDLGPRSQVEQLDIRSGDRIRVRGVEGSINNNPVLVAREVRAGGEWLTIHRTWNRRDFRLRGQVTNLRTVRSAGDEQTHVLATIQTEQGRQVTVDLGRRSMLDQQNILPSRGQRITLIVEPTRAGGRSMLRARMISTQNQMLQRTI